MTSSVMGPVQDTINDLMADPERGKRMGLAGRQRVLDTFSWAEIARETLGLYESVIDD